MAVLISRCVRAAGNAILLEASPLTKPDPDVLIKADPASARQLAGKGVKGTVE